MGHNDSVIASEIEFPDDPIHQVPSENAQAPHLLFRPWLERFLYYRRMQREDSLRHPQPSFRNARGRSESHSDFHRPAKTATRSRHL